MRALLQRAPQQQVGVEQDHNPVPGVSSSGTSRNRGTPKRVQPARVSE
jgi:hypothetical protein